ncbi:T9SS type A sorting domain-containing protein [bacterium]|nr:T9SS type A sorting domain-containing protein [bacterium]
MWMKFKWSLAVGLALAAAGFFVFKNARTNQNTNSREAYEVYLRQHAFYNPQIDEEEMEEAKTDRPDLAWEQDFLLTMDPQLKRPTPERLFDIMARNVAARKLKNVPGDNNSPWMELGPTNVGGRVRAIVFDANDSKHKKVWAGGVTGGLWYTNDITNPDSTWRNVDDFWDNIAVSCLAIDPTDANTMYAGTGEGWRQSISGAPGAGIWKTTDGGKNWQHLSATTNYFYINDLIVRAENGKGVLYVANDYSSPKYATKPGMASSGLYRSEDGGDNFTKVATGGIGSFRVSDLELGADNRLWIGTYYSNGEIYYTDDGSNYVKSVGYNGEGRVELACAPSNANVVYAMFEKSNKVERIAVTTDAGKTWNAVSEPTDAESGIPADDFSRGQAWYDLVLAVDPNNENVVYAGAVDLFKSSDGGSNWQQISHWYGGFGFPEVHADQHAITFKPGSSSEVVFGNDGGIFYSNNVNTSSPQFSHQVKNFNTVQFYACDLHPDTNKAYFLAGAQDNGTQRFQTLGLNQTDRPTGGDGGFCHIDQLDPTNQVTAYVYNRYYRSINNGTYFTQMHWDNTTSGWFINPTDYDDYNKILYAPYSDSALLKLSGINASPTPDYIKYQFGSLATAVKVSPFQTNNATVFAGTASGRLFVIENANSSSPVIAEITSSQFPTGAISSIEFGGSEKKIIITFHNYGVKSVWYSGDGGQNWYNKEGDLPDLPVRWCLMNPTDEDNVILATELGIWSTSNFTANFPNWSQSNNGLANVRVDMLKMRSSDFTILAATHGRGLFTSQGFIFSPPQINKQPASTKICAGKDLVMQVQVSGAAPINYEWYHNGVMVSNTDKPRLKFSKISEKDTGFYYCIARNRDGVAVSDSARLSLYAIPRPNLGPDMTIRPEVKLTLNPGDGFSNYIWSIGLPKPTLTIRGSELGLGTHEVRVIVYTDKLCEGRDTVQITVDENAGIENPEVSLKMYPNPANDFIKIETTGKPQYIRIYDLGGQLLIESKQKNIDLKTLQTGTYIAKIKLEDKVIVRKFDKL